MTARLREWNAVDRLRGRLRRSQIGQDDQQGVTADTRPDPVTEPVSTPGSSIADPLRVAFPYQRLGVPPAVIRTVVWALAMLVVMAAAWVLLTLLAFFSEVTIPLAIALLATALAVPGVDALDRLGLPRGISAFVVVLGGLLLLAGLITLIGQQVASQFDELREDVVTGIDQVEEWLRDGPLNLTQSQLTSAVDSIQETVQGEGGGEVVSRAAQLGATVGQVLTGLFVVLFASFFFCAQGSRVWAWVVALFPRTARDSLDVSGRVAWVSLTAFVRATVLVALADAVGIAIAVVVLQVPLALPLAVVVFLGAFVPIIGAAVSGSVAVLVALVAQGPVVALLMLAAVVAVQQLESHVLQPFLMGRMVALHPLGVILAIAVGLVAGGVVGALIAVPLAACATAVRMHWAGRPDQPAPEP